MKVAATERVTSVAAAGDAAQGRDGRASPQAGNALPRTEASQAALRGTVAELNRFLQQSQREFVFLLDDSTGRTIVRLVNPNTGEVVRQIPADEVLDTARMLRDYGTLLNVRA
ncbi:MAG: flagellar protein FlaG [Steroidobacteraceae bacterium]|nr:flagellar protein FlaG [Steroidobacteraceae bacterium]